VLLPADRSPHLPHSRLLRLLLLSVMWLVLLIGPWYYLAPWLAKPVLVLAAQAMQWVFVWANGLEQNGPVGVLLTTVQVMVPQAGRLVPAHLAPEVDYRTFGYGVVLLWSLLLASRPQHWGYKLLVGAVAIVPAQAVGVCFHWLRDIAIQGGPLAMRHLGWDQWQLELVAYGYQFGFLMLTPLAPVVLWLCMDHRFVRALWVEMTLAGAMQRAASK
jgi:hypothetical protein